MSHKLFFGNSVDESLDIFFFHLRKKVIKNHFFIESFFPFFLSMFRINITMTIVIYTLNYSLSEISSLESEEIFTTLTNFIFNYCNTKI